MLRRFTVVRPGVILVLFFGVFITPLGAESEWRIPEELDELVRNMKDDDVGGNATRAYHTVLNSGKTLSEEDRKTVIVRLKKTIRNGDPQQAILSAAILRRWQGDDSLHSLSKALVPQLVRAIVTASGRSFLPEIRNMMINVYRGTFYRFPHFVTGRSEIEASVPYDTVNRIAQVTTWNGSARRKEEIAIYLARILGPQCRSGKVVRWLTENMASDDTENNGIMAVRAIREMNSDLVVPILKEALDSEDYQKRQYAAYTLTKLDRDLTEKQYIRTLVEGLQDDEIKETRETIPNANAFMETLRNIGEPAYPMLEKALDSDDHQQAQLAAWILHKEDNYEDKNRLIPELIDGLKDDSLQGRGPFANRRWTYDALTNLGEKAHPFLVRALDSDDWQQQLFSAMALIETGYKKKSDRICSIFGKNLAEDDISNNATLTTNFFAYENSSAFVRDHLVPYLNTLVVEGDAQQTISSLYVLLHQDSFPDGVRKEALRRIRTYLEEIESYQSQFAKTIHLFRKELPTGILDDLIEKFEKEVIRKLSRGSALEFDSTTEKLFALLRVRGEYARKHALVHFMKKNQKHERSNERTDLKEKRRAVTAKLEEEQFLRRYLENDFPEISPSYEKQVKEWMKTLRSGTEGEREQAARTLLRQGPKVDPVLGRDYPYEDQKFNKRVRKILVKHGLERAVNKVFDRMYDRQMKRLRNDEIYDYPAAKLLSRYDRKRVLPRMIPLLQSSNGKLRHFASQTLGFYEDEKVRRLLLRYVDDQNPAVRGNVAEALGRMDARKAVPQLKKLAGDKNGSVRRTAVKALRLIGTRPALEAVVDRIPEESNRFVLEESVQAAGKLGGTNAVKSIRGVLKRDPGRDVSRAAIKALSKHAGRKGIQLIRKQLDSRYKEVRREAVKALGKLGDDGSVDRLISMLENEEEPSEAAAEALGELESEKAMKPLVRAVRNGNDFLRREAVQALGTLGTERAVPYLMELYEEIEHHKIRDEIEKAVRNITGQKFSDQYRTWKFDNED